MATGFSFGGGSFTQNPASSAPTFGGLSFGAQTAATTAPAFGFGSTGTSGTAPTLNFGTAGTTGAAPTLNFGTPGVPSAAPTLGFGAPGVSSTAPALSFGATPTSAFPASYSAPTTVGLGGTSVVSAAGLGGLATLPQSGPGKTDAKAVKDFPLPPEMFQGIEEFRKHLKTQHGLGADISHVTAKPLYKVGEEIDGLKAMLGELTSGLQRNVAAVMKLKKDTSVELHHADVAQRTKDLGQASLQMEFASPPHEYFVRVAQGFETQMQQVRRQVEQTERNLAALSQPSALSARELVQVIRKLYESLVVLAGRLQTVHEGVENLKERYGGPGSRGTERDVAARLTDLVGPSPFAGTSFRVATAEASPALLAAGSAPFGGGSTFRSLGFADSAANSTAFPSSSRPVENGLTFQLQSPPGHKRSKR